MSRFFQILSGFAGVCSLGLSFALGWYAIDNQSGHTGLDPYREVLFLQSLAALAAVLSLAVGRGISPIPVTTLVTAVGGALFTVFLDRTGSLREYNRWAHSGLRAPPEFKDIYVAGYLLALLSAAMFVYVRAKRRS